MNRPAVTARAARWGLEIRIELLRMLREPAFVVPVLAFPTLFYLLFGVLLNRGSGAAEYLLAFSCKGRGLCPSCGAKRAAEFAAFLKDEVVADVGHAAAVRAGICQ